MRKPLLATMLVLAIAAAIAVPSIPMTAGTGTPHAIYGILRDGAGNGVAGASVVINNTRTLESLSTQTAAGGSFSVDISNYPLGYVDGDMIAFVASYGQFKAHGNITVVIGESAQYVNLALSCTSHIVKGAVSREDGSSTLNHLVNITEVAQGGTISKLVDIFGMYSIELAFVPGGYAAGDQMVVSCEEGGYEGAATIPISSSQVQWVNITMLDVRPPALSHDAPDNASIGENITIWTAISDNAPFTAVLRYIAVGSGFYEELAMAADAGGASDWDGSGAATPGVYGARIPAQTELGTIQYYIEARDAHNTATSPAENASAAPHSLMILDVIDPTIIGTIPSSVEVGIWNYLEASVMDDVEISSAWVNFTMPGDTWPQLSPMSYTGIGSTWSAPIGWALALGFVNVSFHALDTSGNAGRYPAVGTISIPVIDITPPTGSHVPLNSMEAGSPANITLSTEDNLDVESAVLWIRGVGATGYSPVQMTAGAGGDFTAAVPSQASTGVLRYYLVINDTVGNQGFLPAGGEAAPYLVSVVDIGTPYIQHMSIGWTPLHEPINVTAYIADDIALSNVTLSYTAVDGTYYWIVQMNQTDGSVKSGNFTAYIPSTQALGNIRYFINATDGTNYIHHPALEAYHNVEVRDITAPEINPYVRAPDGASPSMYTPECYVEDDVKIATVYIIYSEPGTGEWTRRQMVYEGTLANATGYYSTDRMGELVGPSASGILYFFEANDTSGNSAIWPPNGYAGPVSEFWYGGAAPNISHMPIEYGGLNETMGIAANITDDEAVEWAILTYKIGTNASVAIQMTKKNETCFAAEIPPVLRSVNSTYRISAGDGQSASLSPEYSFAYVNVPSTVNSTTPDTWPTGEQIVVSGMSEDDVGTRSVTLMHRFAGEPTFTSLAMTKGLLGYWSAELPAFEGLGTLQYYFAAEDDEGVGFSPVGAPAEYLTVEAMDAVAPVISHTAAETYRAGHKPIIVAVVTDDIAVDSVAIHYRNGDANFTEQAMELAQASTNGSFVVQLPAVEAGTLEYYLTASDGTNEARLPSADGTYFAVEVESRPTDYVPYAVVFVVVLLTVIGLLMAYRAMKRQRSEPPPKDDAHAIEDTGEQ